MMEACYQRLLQLDVLQALANRNEMLARIRQNYEYMEREAERLVMLQQ